MFVTFKYVGNDGRQNTSFHLVADPGFNLRGGVDVVNGGGRRKSLKVLKVEV